MDYQLARSLKEAGFPQETYIGAKFYSFMSHPRMGIDAQWAVTTQVGETDRPLGDYYIPILEELIEACANLTMYFGLEKHSNDWRAGKLTTGDMLPFVTGSTPTEAVARLWLALNTKTVWKNIVK